jgi:RimJ/RimL family protein N-acetyltransferase
MELSVGAIAVAELIRVFPDKRGERVAVAPLEDYQKGQLLEHYLAYRPRNSFQGLPPLRDEACIDWVRQMLTDGTHLIAVSQPGDIMGHAALFPIHARVCELLVVVWPGHQNQGIGTELVQSAVRLSEELRFQRIVLSVEATNVQARRVYEKCGFQYRGQACHGEVRMVRHAQAVPPVADAVPRC